jgi:hypothetical protein
LPTDTSPSCLYQLVGLALIALSFVIVIVLIRTVWTLLGH